MPSSSSGQWWTVLSATWLHGGLLHILFNMMWVRDLRPGERRDHRTREDRDHLHGVSGICGFLLSSVAGRYLPFVIPFFGVAPFSVGASASIFGLLGALVHYGNKSGSSLIRAEATRYAIILFVMGVLIRGVDNYAHAGGFIGGYATSWFFNPLTRERGDHTLVAVLCLVATALAVIASVIVGLPRYR